MAYVKIDCSLNDHLVEISIKFGLHVNKAKTKMMIIHWPEKNLPNITVVKGIEVVDSFTYLGFIVENSGGSEVEICHRAKLTKNAMRRLIKIIWLVNTLVFGLSLCI